MDLKEWIRDVPDYPQPGILFRDITPLLSSPEAFKYTVDSICETVDGRPIDAVAAIDARGFLFGGAVAMNIGASLVPLRKENKLPPETIGVNYDLEYGSARLEARMNAVEPGISVLIVDDLLATGGTAAAAGKLMKDLGASVISYAFVIELTDLNGKAALEPDPVVSLIKY